MRFSARSTILRHTLILVAENQNVTLSLPRDLLKRVKRLAADRDTSVSALMTEALSRLADEDRRYSAARKRALAAMKSARSLGTRGPGANDVLRAIELQKQSKLHFWDAMIVHAAAELGCDVLWTEDLNDGQLIRGVRIRDPFAQKQPLKERQGVTDVE
jgi:predicted nucleic acid-binding protein